MKQSLAAAFVLTVAMAPIVQAQDERHQAEVMKKVITILQESPERVRKAHFMGQPGENFYDGGLAESLFMHVLTTPGCYRVKALSIRGELVLRYLNSKRYLESMSWELEKANNELAMVRNAQAVAQSNFGVEPTEVSQEFKTKYAEISLAVKNTSIEVDALWHILSNSKMKLIKNSGKFNVHESSDFETDYGWCTRAGL